MNSIRATVLLMWCCLFLWMNSANAQETSLVEVLKAAEISSPRLKSAKFRSEALRQNTRAEKSAYLPQLDFAAVASNGDPGSFAFNGVDNNISASQRIGEGGALVLKQNIWDFGRTSSAIAAAESAEELQKNQFYVSKMDIDREVLQTYLNCSILKSQVQDSKFMAEQARLMAKETNRFVTSGQRSVIERYLVDAQEKEADTRTAEYLERVSIIEIRLGIELGLAENTPVHCTDLAHVEMSLKQIKEAKVGSNPVLAVLQTRIKFAQSRLERAKSEAMPSLLGLATGGYFDNDVLKNKLNYSVGIGLVIPLFSGFKIESSVGQQAADLNAEQANLESSRQSVNQTNSRYEEQIRSLTVRLDFLREENKLARQTFDLAKKRYLSLQGTMIDLRESIRNLDRVLQSIEETYHDLYLAKGELALFNGSRNLE